MLLDELVRVWPLLVGLGGLIVYLIRLEGSVRTLADLPRRVAHLETQAARWQAGVEQYYERTLPAMEARAEAQAVALGEIQRDLAALFESVRAIRDEVSSTRRRRV